MCTYAWAHAYKLYSPCPSKHIGNGGKGSWTQITHGMVLVTYFLFFFVGRVHGWIGIFKKMTAQSTFITTIR